MYRHRSGSHDHRDAAPRKGGRQVCRVLWSVRPACPSRAVPRSVIWRPNTARRLVFSDRWADARALSRHRRSDAEVAALGAYFRAQGMFGVPKATDLAHTRLLTLDLGSVVPSLAGPKRPQDRIDIGAVKSTFADLYSKPIADNGFNQPARTNSTASSPHRPTPVCAMATFSLPPSPRVRIRRTQASCWRPACSPKRRWRPG